MYNIVMNTHPDSCFIPGIIKHFFFSKRCELTFDNLAELIVFLEKFNYKLSSGVSVSNTETKASLRFNTMDSQPDRFAVLFRSEDFFAAKGGDGMSFSELRLMLRLFDEKVLNEEKSKYHFTKKNEKVLLPTYFIENGFNLDFDVI